MQTEQLTRAFRYNSVDLVDPGAQYSPEQVRDFYSAAYPEIVSAGIDGPEQSDGKLVYSFRRAVGTKGVYYCPPEGQPTTEADLQRMADNVVEWSALSRKTHAERVELARQFGPNWASVLSGCGDQ